MIQCPFVVIPKIRRLRLKTLFTYARALLETKCRYHQRLNGRENWANVLYEAVPSELAAILRLCIRLDS